MTMTLIPLFMSCKDGFCFCHTNLLEESFGLGLFTTAGVGSTLDSPMMKRVLLISYPLLVCTFCLCRLVSPSHCCQTRKEDGFMCEIYESTKHCKKHSPVLSCSCVCPTQMIDIPSRLRLHLTSPTLDQIQAIFF